jgi:hypothetical protein
VRLCWFLVVGGNGVVVGNSSQNENTYFDFLWAVSTKKSYWVTLLWSTSQCVYFVRPNTLLLCIFLFCIFLLYRTDPQVEVQIRVLLKDKYVKSSHYDFLYTVSKKNSYWFSLFYRNNSLTKVYFSWDPNFLLLRNSFLHCMWIYNLTVTIISQKYRKLSLQVEISEKLQYSFNARWK